MTIAIPFRDEDELLGAAIRAVLRQTFEDFELLLIDDGSTDGSLDVARSFDDRRIVVVSDGETRGLPARLNEVTRRARAELVARMDADDVVHPTRLAKQIERLREGACDVVGTWAALVDDRESPFAVVETAPLPPSPAVALTRGVVPHASIVARRSWLAAHPYDEALTRAEDRDLWARTAEDTRFGVVPEPLYVVRVITTDPRFLPDYVEAQRQNRAILVAYGPRILGWPETVRQIGAAHVKAGAMRVVVRAGLAPRLVRRRGRRPTAGELTLIREALEAGRPDRPQRP